MTGVDYFTSLCLLFLRQEIKLFKLNLMKLHRQNLDSRSPVTGLGNAVVCLTTYGKRLETVYLALESIAAGTTLPSRLILWIDDRTAFENRPQSVRRLEKRGLEVYFSQNYGPHTKYYPYLLTTDVFVTPLVTADDDVVYSKWWLGGLIQAYRQHPDTVNCYRARVIKLEEGEIGQYNSWKNCNSTEADCRHFATGVSGCIYPPGLLYQLKRAGLGFQQVAPSADDIWLNVQALRGGFKVRQVRSRAMRFPLIPGTQGTALWRSNVILARNDEQMKRTFTAKDLSLLNSQLVYTYPDQSVSSGESHQ